MLMKLYKPGKQRGIGLLELMLSLAIIAILLVMATRYYLITKSSQEVNQTASLIGVLQGAVANWKAGKATYTGLGTDGGAILNSMGLVPSPNWDGTQIVNLWGNKVLVSSSGTGGNTATISMQLPQKACLSVADKLGNDKFCATGTLTYVISGTTGTTP